MQLDAGNVSPHFTNRPQNRNAQVTGAWTSNKSRNKLQTHYRDVSKCKEKTRVWPWRANKLWQKSAYWLYLKWVNYKVQKKRLTTCTLRAEMKEKVWKCESTRAGPTVACVSLSSITGAVVGVHPQLPHLLFQRLHQAPWGTLEGTLKHKCTHTLFSFVSEFDWPVEK